MSLVDHKEARRRQQFLEVVHAEDEILLRELGHSDREGESRETQTTDPTRRGYNADGRLKTMGLALSGGGIRAASFALGVMQGLNIRQAPGTGDGDVSDDDDAPQARLLDYVDYLSTVSGGGYAGAAFSYYRHLGRQREQARDKGPRSTFDTPPPEELSLKHFPEPEYDVLNRRESRMIDFSRFRRNHLTPDSTLSFASLLAIALRTVIISWPIYLSAMTLAMIGIYLLAFASGELIPSEFSHWLFQLCQGVVPHDTKELSQTPGDERFVVFAAVVTALAVLAYLANSTIALLVSGRALYMSSHYSLRRFSQGFIGKALLLAVLGLVLAVTPLVATLVADGPTRAALMGALIAGNAAGGAGVLSIKIGALVKPLLSVQTIVVVAAIVLLFGNLVFAYEIAELIVAQAGHWLGLQAASEVTPRHGLGALALGAILAFTVLGLRANINYVSLHRMYRDRLMEAFMPNLQAAMDKDNTELATDADQLHLKELTHRPLHFVNTNVVLSNSGDSRYRGRAGDSFILAPHYCGSWATGWRRTEEFSATPDSDPGMTLATAMTISGAAVNPRVGPSGWATPISNPIASAMASFLNLRLGCWVANPDARDQGRQANFFNAGLKGLFNSGFSEQEQLVELTDGGHFENTGIYELLRRRVDVIVFCDASADQQFNFKDLGIAIERARVDLSVDIRFADDNYDLRHLMPGSAGEELYEKRYELATRGYAMGTIEYPPLTYDSPQGEVTLPAHTGTFIYLKSVITPDMPADIYSYRGAFPEFPYQPITDQMFDESQFESYRELGFRVAARMNEEQHERLRQDLRTDHAPT